MTERKTSMHKMSVRTVGAFCLALFAALTVPRPAGAQATIVFTSPVVTVDQGASSVDFFGQIDNSQAGAVTFTPSFIQISGDLSSLATTYDSFGNPDNLPASVAAGTVSSTLDFFSMDTSSLAPGTYSGVMALTDSNSANVATPQNFSVTIVATPEPSALIVLAVGAAGLGVLTLRARRSRAD